MYMHVIKLYYVLYKLVYILHNYIGSYVHNYVCSNIRNYRLFFCSYADCNRN